MNFVNSCALKRSCEGIFDGFMMNVRVTDHFANNEDFDFFQSGIMLQVNPLGRCIQGRSQIRSTVSSVAKAINTFAKLNQLLSMGPYPIIWLK